MPTNKEARPDQLALEGREGQEAFGPLAAYGKRSVGDGRRSGGHRDGGRRASAISTDEGADTGGARKRPVNDHGSRLGRRTTVRSFRAIRTPRFRLDKTQARAGLRKARRWIIIS